MTEARMYWIDLGVNTVLLILGTFMKMNVMGTHHLKAFLELKVSRSAAADVRALFHELDVGEWQSIAELKLSYPSLNLTRNPEFSFGGLSDGVRVDVLFSFETGDVIIRKIEKSASLKRDQAGKRAA